MTSEASCELCTPPQDVLFESPLAYVRLDNNSLSRGHVLVVPRRHVASFFDMDREEQSAVLDLLNLAQKSILAQHSPDGYNIGVNVGKAAGQSRMHVHLHLIPRYEGDVPDPRGGIRCVLAGTTVALSGGMATAKQRKAARRNIGKAAKAAKAAKRKRGKRR